MTEDKKKDDIEISKYVGKYRLFMPLVVLVLWIKYLFGGNPISIRQYMEIYLSKDKFDDERYKRRLVPKLYYYLLRYGFVPNEYINFDFEHKSKKERLQYIGALERLNIFKAVNDESVEAIYQDKFSTYEKYEKFFKREMIYVTGTQDLIPFSIFVNNHDKFMFKPTDQSCGRGIMKVNTKNDEFTMMTFFKSMLVTGPAVVEEIIEQVPEMAVFHPESVNTIRFTTIYRNGKLTKMYSIIRIGVGESFVDNAGAGGISCAIDLDTGVICSDGYSEIGGVYKSHPDTGVVFKGTQIPKWNELLNMVEELVKVVPEQEIIGWDLALTDKGWTMIEANCRPIITAAQMCHNKGFRKDVYDLWLGDTKYRKAYNI